MPESLVTPRPGTEPAPAPEVPTEAAAPAEGGELPDEVLRVPIVQALMAGQPPAVSAPIADMIKKPDAELLMKNKDALFAAGIGLYRSLSGELGVVFNQLAISGEEIQAADKAGQLQTLAPDWDQVTLDIQKSGENHPALSAKGPTGPRETPPAVAPQSGNSAPIVPNVPAQGAAGSGLPAGAQRKLAGARAANMQAGSPLSGAAPGAGRLLNSVLKPVL